jgi:acetyl esterase
MDTFNTSVEGARDEQRLPRRGAGADDERPDRADPRAFRVVRRRPVVLGWHTWSPATAANPSPAWRETAPVALTPHCRRLLDRFDAVGVLPFDRMSVLEARASVAMGVSLQGDPVAVAHVEDVLAPGAAGQLPVRLYHPDPGELLPLLVYFHGGGWVTGSVEVADTPCRALAARTRTVVASVDYRLSPETKYPGPAQDCLAATTWLAANSQRWSADASRLVVIGDSAGGNLAAAVTLMARDRGSPAIASQVLLYPPLAPARGSTYASYQENGEGYGLTRGGIEWFWDHYLPSQDDVDDPYCAPLRASDLSALPPALVITAQYDPLRDEGLAYVSRLAAAGVDAVSLNYPGLIHGFFWMARALPEGAEVVGAVARHLSEYLRPSHPPAS